MLSTEYMLLEINLLKLRVSDVWLQKNAHEGNKGMKRAFGSW